MTWTKTPPTRDGWYWWRADADYEPDVWYVSQRQIEEGTQDSGHGGEFWDEPLKPPLHVGSRGSGMIPAPPSVVAAFAKDIGRAAMAEEIATLLEQYNAGKLTPVSFGYRQAEWLKRWRGC